MKTLRETIAEAIYRHPNRDVADAYKIADDALATFREWLEKNGLAVVPREATDGMKDKVAERPGPWPRNGIREQFAREDRLRKWAGVGSMYAAMIAAAPEALKASDGAPPSPGAITGIRKAADPCSDCIDGWCQMNCGPRVG